ncbi:hypothetical protein ACI780_24150 [Geodermatophilus sp. SYSU D00814]
MSAVDLLAALAAACLLAAMLYAVAAFVRAARSRALFIAPFLVTGREDPEGRLGRAMALMLHGRMQQLRREFEASREELITPRDPAPEMELDPKAILRSPRVILPVTVLPDPPPIDVKLAGIEFGGLAAWLDRTAARTRTLTVAVHFGTDRALITANLSPLPGVDLPDLWLQTTPEPGEVVTALAYALLQARMAADRVGAIGALRPEEFSGLLTSISLIADLNRRAAAGRARSAEDYRAVLACLSSLPDKVPEWDELTYLVARVADHTGDSAQALYLYRRLVKTSGTASGLQPTLREAVARRIEALDTGIRPAADAREKAFLEEVDEYVRRLGLEPPHPQIGFMRHPKEPGVRAIWEEGSQRYEVNPDTAADPGREAAKEAALMGRFMYRHFGRCASSVDYQFWNEFRISVVDFLVMTEPGSMYQSEFHYPLLETLQAIGRRTGVGAARRLALSAIDHFDCDWNSATLPDRLALIGARIGVPEDITLQAFSQRPAHQPTAP